MAWLFNLKKKSSNFLLIIFLTNSQNGHDSANIQQCLCGQKGFGRNATSDNQSNKAKNQLIAATSICFVFMVSF